MKNAPLKTSLKTALIIGGVCALIPTVHGQGIGQQAFERMLVPTPQRVERGARLYAEQCATCHGDQGRGGAPLGQQLDPPALGFVSDQDWQGSRGLVSIYNVVSKGLEDVDHPVFTSLYVQDQWAVAHYVHSLAPEPRLDPADVIERARFEAIHGVCDDAIRETIADVVQPTGEEQIQQGRELYAAQCASCHGAQGAGDGPAAGALNPPPRDFTAAPAEWTEGTSPLAIFNVITRGVDGTSMPAYSHLPEAERWALTHFIRSEIVPEANRQEATDDQIEDVCRALSAAPRPPAIPLERAIQFLAQDAAEQRLIRLSQYGDVYLSQEANPSRGEQLYTQSCASCHGVQGKGVRNYGPHGTFPPYMYLNVPQLVPAAAGGTYEDFARRSIAGPHATLPDMSFPAVLSAQDWQDLQAYVAHFEGEGTVRVGPPPSDPEPEQLEQDEPSTDLNEDGAENPDE